MPTPQRLPIVNSDDGVWGDILRQYLKKEHYDDGTDNAINGGHKTITIRPGTASAGTAPLKFTSGTLLTTPEAGAVEFAGDNYYLTDTSGPTRRKIAAYDDTSGATGDIYYRNSSGYFSRLGIGSTGDLLTVSGGMPSWSSSISNASTITLKDTNFTLQDDGDTTKQVKFQASGITTGITRTLTVPDADGTIALDTTTNLKQPVRVTTMGWETYTISSGTVTQIDGTVINGVTVAIGDRVLVKDAPASSGGASKNSSQPGNGIYVVTGNTTNISLSRASDMTGGNSPYGALVSVVEGNTANGGGLFQVTTPSSSGAFTYGADNIHWISYTNSVVFNASADAGNNLVIDPSFEDTSIYRDQWWSAGSGYSTEQARTGTHSIKLIENLADPNSGGWDGFDLVPNAAGKFLEVTPGQVFYGEMWVYPLASTGTMDFSFYLTDSSGTNPHLCLSFVTPVDPGNSSGRLPTPTANTWTKIGGITVTIPAGYDQAEPYFQLNADSDGLVVYVDDAYITDVTDITTTNLTLTNKTIGNTNTVTLKDANFTLQDDGDTTKQLKFQLSGITTATTRTLTIPNVNGTIITTGDTGTVTNTMLAGSIANAKLASSAITIAGTSTSLGASITQDTITGLASTGLVKRTGANTLAIATAGTDYTTPTGAESLTNKTLTDPKINAIKDSNGNNLFGLTTTASAVNYIGTTNNAAGAYPTLWTTGSDTNVGMYIATKGSGQIKIYVPTAQTPTLAADGVDSNHDLNLLSKGSGVVKVNSNPVVSSVTGIPAVTGTPSSSNYLRGDGTWSAVAANTGMLQPVKVMIPGSATYTISGGTVTQIAGITFWGYSPAIGDRILIAGAPATTGAGSTYVITTQPTNGIYVVTGNTTNLSVSRAADMSGSVDPTGLSVYIETGGWNNGGVFTVSTVLAAGATFTYGTTAMTWSGTGGSNPSVSSLYINGNGAIGYWNGTGTTYIQSSVNAGDATLTLPATATADTIVGRASTDTLTNKRITARVGTTASSATPSINTDSYDQYNITALAVAITSMTTNLTGTPTDGQKLMIRIKDNGTARAITWGASFVASGASALLTTTVVNKTHLCNFMYDSAAAKWVAIATDFNGY